MQHHQDQQLCDYVKMCCHEHFPTKYHIHVGGNNVLHLERVKRKKRERKMAKNIAFKCRKKGTMKLICALLLTWNEYVYNWLYGRVNSGSLIVFFACVLFVCLDEAHTQSIHSRRHNAKIRRIITSEHITQYPSFRENVIVGIWYLCTIQPPPS